MSKTSREDDYLPLGFILQNSSLQQKDSNKKLKTLHM